MQARNKLVRAKYVKGEATLEKIREACMEEIVTRGYHHTSVCEIVRRARLTRGAFYNYWVSLDDCIADLLLVVREIVRNDPDAVRFAEQLEEPSEILKKMRTMLHLVLDRGSRYPLFPIALMTEKDLGNQELKQLLKDYVASVQQEWTAVVRADQESGIVRRDIDPATAAAGIMVFMRSLLDQAVMLPDYQVERMRESFLLYLGALLSEGYRERAALERVMPERLVASAPGLVEV